VSPDRGSDSLPIWSCSVWGFGPARVMLRGGALLPHLFTLTPAAVVTASLITKESHRGGGVCFLWHFPVERAEPVFPDVIRHTALRSSELSLPRPISAGSDRPVGCNVFIMRCGVRASGARRPSMIISQSRGGYASPESGYRRNPRTG